MRIELSILKARWSSLTVIQRKHTGRGLGRSNSLLITALDGKVVVINKKGEVVVSDCEPTSTEWARIKR